MDNRAIGIFDSGVGGLTVLKELQKKLKNENYIYIGDTASFPYGNKTKQTIIELCKKRIEDLIKLDVKLIVIACGTATSQALDEIKSIFKIPIIGIIEPTVEYLQERKMRNIGVIATTGTIKSRGWQNEISKKIIGAKVIGKACPLLAPMAEEGWTENEIAKLTIHEYLKDFNNIDSLILGCTHYPLFKSIIEEELDKNVNIINTGEMVANKLRKFIEENSMNNLQDNISQIEIYLTDLECNFIEVAKKILNISEINVKKI